MEGDELNANGNRTGSRVVDLEEKVEGKEGGKTENVVEEVELPEKPWPLLILAAQAGFGLYFGYDTISALTPPIKSEYGFTDADIGSIISAYALATIILIFFGGALYSFFGPRKMLIGTTFLNTSGIFVMANSTTFTGFYVGQLLFGSGSCFIYFSVITLIGGWFTGPNKKFKLNVAVGCLHFWLRMGTTLCFSVLPKVNSKMGLKTALFTSFVVCSFSFLSAILFVVLDTIATKKQMERYAQMRVDSIEMKVEDSIESEENRMKDLPLRDVSERGFFSSLKRNSTQILECYMSFPLAYWLVVLMAFGFISTLYTFTSFGGTMLVQRGYEYSDSMFIVGLTGISNGISTPFVSTMVGLLGNRTWFALLAGCGTVLCYLAFWSGMIYPGIIFVALGLSQSLMDAVLFPCISIIIDKKVLSYSTSLTIFLYSFGLFLMGRIIGLLGSKDMWVIAQLTLLGAGSLCVLGGFGLRINRLRNDLDKK